MCGVVFGIVGACRQLENEGTLIIGTEPCNNYALVNPLLFLVRTSERGLSMYKRGVPNAPLS